MLYKGAGFISFAFGIIIGAGVSYFLTKKKYERLIDSEIESVKEAFRNRAKDSNDELGSMFSSGFKTGVEEASTAMDSLRDSVLEVANVAATTRHALIDYTKFSSTSNYEKPVEDEDSSIKPIDESEFGEDPDYKTIELRLDSDGILSDARFNAPYDDSELPEDLLNCLKSMNVGDCDQRCVYLKDYENKVYYVIQKTSDRYTDDYNEYD